MNAKTILVVDDEPLSVKILCHHLRKEYTVDVASNGEQALQMAGGDTPPDLILLDVMMPGMDGYEVCAALKANPLTDAIPVIFITGLSEGADEQRGLDLGAVDFVVKPVSASRVRARVRNPLELKAYRDHLETVVKERTAELLNKQQQLENINCELEQQHLELEKHRAHLEALVKERTGELLLKQQQLEELNSELEERVIAEVRKNREKDSLLVYQEKLASIGQLAAGVAHEINNPMSFVTSNLRTLKSYASIENEYRAALEAAVTVYCPSEECARLVGVKEELEIPYILDDTAALITESLEGAERVRKIVLDLKDFARLDGDGIGDTNLNDCVQSAVSIVRNEINTVAELELSLADIPLVFCNAQQINQVIANILVNAVNAITPWGKIAVSTECVAEYVQLTFSDSGRGIPADIIGRIFDPFFTTRDVGKGTGLGLSISYDIVKKHGGEITVSSEVGVGTVFVVRLPVAGPLETENISG